MDAPYSLHLGLDAPELHGADTCSVTGRRPYGPDVPLGGTGPRPWPRCALCILLSLAVHCAMLAIPGGVTTPGPPLVMELSLGWGAGSGNGKPAGGGPDQGPSPAMQTSSSGELSRPQPPEPEQPPVVAARTHERPAPALPQKNTMPRRKTVHAARTPLAAPAPQPVPPMAEDPTESSSEPRDASAGDQIAAGDTKGTGGAGDNAGSGAGGAAGGTGSGGDGAPLTFGDIGAPSFSFQAPPKYPRQSVARKEQGTVTLLIHLDEQGHLRGVEIATSAGPRLDEAALEAARASSYRPAVKDGSGIPCRAFLRMRFTLRG